MKRAMLFLLFLQCATTDAGPVWRAHELELQASAQRIAALEELLWSTRAEVARLRSEMDVEAARLTEEVGDARMLTLVGGPPPLRVAGRSMRWSGGPVTCNGGNWLPGSNGGRAYRALKASGWCDPPELPAPDELPTVLVSQ